MKVGETDERMNERESDQGMSERGRDRKTVSEGEREREWGWQKYIMFLSGSTQH